MTKTVTKAALAAALALSLASCGNDAGEATAAGAEPGDETLAEVLADAGTLSTAAGAFEETGLVGVLEGEASYTVLAPSDAAFEALGADARDALQGEEQGALMAAILREHMLPGALTPEAIREALNANDGTVEVASFGAGTLSFRSDGNDIVVSNEAGQSARLTGEAVAGSNGVVIPIDAVLVDPAALP